MHARKQLSFGMDLVPFPLYRAHGSLARYVVARSGFIRDLHHRGSHHNNLISNNSLFLPSVQRDEINNPDNATWFTIWNIGMPYLGLIWQQVELIATHVHSLRVSFCLRNRGLELGCPFRELILALI